MTRHEPDGPPSDPVVIDHELHFPSREAAAVFVDIAKMRGFRLTELAAEPDAAGKFVVELSRLDSPDRDHVYAVTQELAELAAPYDGDHSGWTCVDGPSAP